MDTSDLELKLPRKFKLPSKVLSLMPNSPSFQSEEVIGETRLEESILFP